VGSLSSRTCTGKEEMHMDGAALQHRHDLRAKVDKEPCTQVTRLIGNGNVGVIDGDVFFVLKSISPYGQDDVRVGDTFELLLEEYRPMGRKNYDGYRFFGKAPIKIENSEEHRERRENRQHQVQGSRGGGSSRASPPPGRERRRESDEKDRRVRKDESRREEGGGSQRLQVGDGIRVSSRKEASVWFRGKVTERIRSSSSVCYVHFFLVKLLPLLTPIYWQVTDILPDGGGEIDGDICVSPWRRASEADGSGTGRTKKTNVEWSKCNIRKGDIVTVSAKPCLPMRLAKARMTWRGTHCSRAQTRGQRLQGMVTRTLLAHSQILTIKITFRFGSNATQGKMPIGGGTSNGLRPTGCYQRGSIKGH